MNNYLIKTSLTVGVVLCLSSCSTLNNMKGVQAIKSSFNAHDEKIKQFDKGETKATHNDEEVVGDSLTLITPKGAVLEDHLVLGNRTYTFTERGDMNSRFTYITKTTPQKSSSIGSFSYIKTKCKKQSKNPFLSTDEYIDNTTYCLMNRGDDFPEHGMVATYEGTYAIKHGEKSDFHEINMTKAQSIHTVTPNLWEGSIILDMDDMATEKDFYDLFKRYKDDTMTFKFKQHSPKELQSAIFRQARHMHQKEKVYINYVNSLAKGEQYNFVSSWVLDSDDGIITFRFGIERYKNNGSILTITPTYYPSSQEVGSGPHKTINFARKREKIMVMIDKINNE